MTTFMDVIDFLISSPESRVRIARAINDLEEKHGQDEYVEVELDEIIHEVMQDLKIEENKVW